MNQEMKKDNRIRSYIAIDLKSFYASVECVERNLNPLTTNLVVADESRTEKTICLAVSPSLKSYGIPGRARLFEVVQKVKEVNKERLVKSGIEAFREASYEDEKLKNDRSLSVGYIVAPPRMALYMEYSTRIYDIYLKYVAPEDMHVYSVDEVFIDATEYLNIYQMSAKELAMHMVKDVFLTTGITATAGIGTNMYLAKIAMDIVAKKMEPDENGARIAVLDEMKYRELLWEHRPLTDFWRVGPGYRKKLEENGLFTMGDIARCSLGKETDYYNEDLLFRLFGVNAEFLIDHAWGYEPCLIQEVKAYKPSVNSLSTGQVLTRPYSFEEARVVIREMADALSLDLVSKDLITDQIVLTVGYDIDNIGKNKGRSQAEFQGEITIDRYGRKVPKHAHGTQNLEMQTHSTKQIIDATLTLYDRIVDPDLLVRRMSVAAVRVVPTSEKKENTYHQMNLFTDFGEKSKEEKKTLEREERMQKAILSLKNKYGKNAVLKGTDFREGATSIERNSQIGGHKA